MTQTTARHERASDTHISSVDGGPGKSVPLRKCLVTGESFPKGQLLRFVAAPDGQVVPDFGAELPGRGFYLVPSRANLETAVKKRLFARGAKQQISISDGFVDAVADQARKRTLQRLGLARANGALVAGFSKVQAAFAKGNAGLYVCAEDTDSDDAAKLLAKLPAYTKFVRLFTSAELGAALGRENPVHLAVTQGRQCQALVKALTVVKDLSNTPPDLQVAASGAGTGKDRQTPDLKNA